MAGKKGARRAIPNKIVNLLWAISAGRCQMCNTVLYQDLLTKKQVNSAYIAHIVDVNHQTHRYDKDLSPKLETDISNLMLLCDTHHRLIDNEGEKDYTVERLQKIKREHEERIQKLTEITSDKQSFIIEYSLSIGEQQFQTSYQEIKNAVVFDGLYPAEDTPIILSCSEAELKDSEEDFWNFHSKNLIKKYSRRVNEKVESGELMQASVFAVAQQPLLILLGVLLGDVKTITVYPKNREGISWGWRSKQKNNDFKLVPSDKKNTKSIALKIAISANIRNERIESILGKDCAIWEITIPECSNDYLKSKYQAKYFREIAKKALHDIKDTYGEDISIHVFPAMPVALAVEFGRIRMPKADLPLILYDQNRDRKGFIKAISIPDCLLK